MLLFFVRVLGLGLFAFLLVRAALAGVVWGPSPRGGFRPSLAVGCGVCGASLFLGLFVLAVWGLWRVLSFLPRRAFRARRAS